MADDVMAIQRRFVEEYQGLGKVEVGEELLADDFVDHSPPPGLPADKQGVLMFFAAMRAGMPDLHVEIHDMLADGDKVVTRKTFHGTHLGELMGAPPTGNAVHVDVIDILRIENGRLREHWNVVDMIPMLQALGLMPSA